MLLEDTRFSHEDLERLEQGISDRAAEDPKHVSKTNLRDRLSLKSSLQIRDRLSRDHQISGFLTRVQEQSKRLVDIYSNIDGQTKEIQAISTSDPFDEFYNQLNDIKSFHRKYPNEPVENLERAYKRRIPTEGESATANIDNMFTGEEAFGKFLDLTSMHEDYLNIPGIKRLSYLQYLDIFDVFYPPQCPIKHTEKQTDQYFNYAGRLASYLEDFIKRTKPLDDLEQLFESFDEEFNKLWEAKEIPGWNNMNGVEIVAPVVEGAGRGLWCPDCGKEFKNDNVYESHLAGRKHIKATRIRASQSSKQELNPNALPASVAQHLKQRAIAEREHRIARLATTLSSTRSATRVNVERRQGMTERERQQELEALYAESADLRPTTADDSDVDSDSSEKIYNPLKLPLAWDGKPIPFWLYKLHGLGVELPCEICGNFVYMGRRAFDKHFSEGRHVYGLKCLGITNTPMFREITGIEDALKLWDKLQRDKRVEAGKQDIVQMEDAEGNVMPEKVYYEYVCLLSSRSEQTNTTCSLQKQGLL